MLLNKIIILFHSGALPFHKSQHTAPKLYYFIASKARAFTVNQLLASAIEMYSLLVTQLESQFSARLK